MPRNRSPRPRTLAQAITDALAEEGLQATQQGIAKFLKRYARTYSFTRGPGSGRPTKISQAESDIIEAQMQDDLTLSNMSLYSNVSITVTFHVAWHNY